MIRIRHLVSALGLAAGLAACTVHGQGTMAVDTSAEVVYSEPPQPQAEVVTEARPGFVWIRGRWNWRHGQWAWVGGHWERERAGYVWSEGQWQRRGNQWVWVEGTWTASSTPATGVVVRDHRDEAAPPPAGGVVVRDHRDEPAPPPAGGVVVGGGASVTISAYPTAAPPAPQAESPGTKSGFVWIYGRWNWMNGKWEWTPGHWERERANMVWVAGKWQLEGGRWVWMEGRWEAAPAPGPTVRDHRH